MIPLYWLIAFAVLVGVEVATMALTTVWFAGGAMVAFFLALMKFDVDIQLLAFVVSSFIRQKKDHKDQRRPAGGKNRTGHRRHQQ